MGDTAEGTALRIPPKNQWVIQFRAVHFPQGESRDVCVHEKQKSTVKHRLDRAEILQSDPKLLPVPFHLHPLLPAASAVQTPSPTR